MPKHGELITWGWAKPGQYWQGMWRKYKLTPERFEVIWHEQSGQCAGCLDNFAHPTIRIGKQGVMPNVDHLHRFDAAGNLLQVVVEDVRGLLCSRCNTLLGKLRDDQVCSAVAGIYERAW